MIQLYIYIFFSIIVYHRILNKFPVLYSRAMLCINSIYYSLHLLTPTSHSIPTRPPHPLGNYKSVLYDCESVSVS